MSHQGERPERGLVKEESNSEKESKKRNGMSWKTARDNAPTTTPRRNLPEVVMDDPDMIVVGKQKMMRSNSAVEMIEPMRANNADVVPMHHLCGSPERRNVRRAESAQSEYCKQPNQLERCASTWRRDP
eukprot:scaffold1899_cov70-Skeletonema_menzelii.AAC.5